MQHHPVGYGTLSHPHPSRIPAKKIVSRPFKRQVFDVHTPTGQHIKLPEHLRIPHRTHPSYHIVSKKVPVTVISSDSTEPVALPVHKAQPRQAIHHQPKVKVTAKNITLQSHHHQQSGVSIPVRFGAKTKQPQDVPPQKADFHLPHLDPLPQLQPVPQETTPPEWQDQITRVIRRNVQRVEPHLPPVTRKSFELQPEEYNHMEDALQDLDVDSIIGQPKKGHRFGLLLGMSMSVMLLGAGVIGVFEFLM